VVGVVDESVLTVDNTASPARYRLLETLRDYGLRKLEGTGETRRIRRKHYCYYRTLVATASATWLGPSELDAMAAVYRDLPDILAAVDECITRPDLPTAQAICRDLVRVRGPFFYGFLDVARKLLHRVIEASGQAANAEEAVDLSSTAACAAWVAVTQGEHHIAHEQLTAAHDSLRQWGIPPTPVVLFAEGGSEALGAGSPRAIGLLASARAAFTDPANAGDHHMATMLWAMAAAFADEPDAVAASREYLRQAQDAQAPWATSWALWTAALAALRNGSHQQATDHIGHCLRLQRDMGDQWGQTWSIELAAWIIADQLDHAHNPAEDARHAAWLLGAARARQQRLGVTLSGLRPLADGHARAQKHIAALLDELTLASIMDAGSRGHAQAVKIALGEQTSRKPTASDARRLTDRESEIATLVAQGLTSAEIGTQLRIQPGTVDVHIANIKKKLGVRTRAAIAASIVANSRPKTPTVGRW
jgi:DNA-binding CsgD family transcriptional regulator